MTKLDVVGPADYEKLAEIMSGPHGTILTPQSAADLLIVFSCADPEVGREAARLHRQRLVRRVIFSGNVGKDSAELPILGITEAVFLASVAIAEGMPADGIVLEQEARNGKENAVFSLRLAAAIGVLPTGARVVGLAPATRSRRLYEELRYQASSGSYPVDVVAGFSSGAADPDDAQVRAELTRELIGLRTMHEGNEPRIHFQPQFQPGGEHWALAERVCASESASSPNG